MLIDIISMLVTATMKMHYVLSVKYRKSSIKRRSAYSKLDFFDAALNRGQCLFKGGAYSKA